MGFQFSIEHAGIVSYLTIVKSDIPVVENAVFISFFGSLADVNRHGEPRLISRGERWIKSINQIALATFHSVTEALDDEPGDGLVEPDVFLKFVNPLLEYFRGYELYALILTSEDIADKQARAFFEYGARASGGRGLFLLPDGKPTDFTRCRSDENELQITFLDPDPIIQMMATAPVARPSVLFWTASGAACILPISEARAAYDAEFGPALQQGNGNVDLLLRKASEKLKYKRILHLSDLHLGSAPLIRKKNNLKQHLRNLHSRTGDFDRIVITGDMFDNPDQDASAIFDELRMDLGSLSKQDAIVVPGNHDCRWHGNQYLGLGTNYQYIVDAGYSPIIVDPNIRTVFFCFNSSELGDYARGGISDNQRLARVGLFDHIRTRDSVIDSYLRVALIHHHPVAYSPEPLNLFDKMAATIFGRGDALIELQDAPSFLNWCASMKISVILHGHKHIPFNRAKYIKTNGRYHPMRVVGCGSSTGKGNTPMSYDIINLDPDNGILTVSFWRDTSGDGSSFKLHAATLATGSSG
ncbi:hypothetical protein GR210_01390 [Rhizobium leguminosarum]|uniref:metallophosphoesterase family protein n=1 Tax=Rhizobium leguminosarum TaxID=384 RepID=UPI0013DB5005|nr:metallophosphoesterase [Rhizobium leguminosarum]NEH47446.1 hypothetical protein [Rhizobium leguminosarum]